MSDLSTFDISFVSSAKVYLPEREREISEHMTNDRDPYETFPVEKSRRNNLEQP